MIKVMTVREALGLTLIFYELLYRVIPIIGLICGSTNISRRDHSLRPGYLKCRDCNRMAFRIAKKATPTSANTACHMVAIPRAPPIKIMAFMPSAK